MSKNGRQIGRKVVHHNWHIWGEDPSKRPLEFFVRNLSSEDTLTVCSAEESYYPANQLIDKDAPLDFPDSFGNYGEFQKNIKKLKSVDFILGVDDRHVVDDYKLLGHVHTWDTFFLYLSFLKIDTRNLNTDNYKKVFIFMNTKAHTHRCLLMDIVAYYDLLPYSIYSWHNSPTGWHTVPHMWKAWEPTEVTFDENYDAESKDRGEMQHIIPKEVNDVFMFLVSETFVNQNFITEKTWHPILLGKPFLTYGCPGFYQKLTKYGFKLYDEIFDYSFDIELKDSRRAELIAQEIFKIKESNLNKLHDTIKHKLEYNKNLALDMIKNKVGVPEIAYSFDHYKEILDKVEDKINE